MGVSKPAILIRWAPTSALSTRLKWGPHTHTHTFTYEQDELATKALKTALKTAQVALPLVYSASFCAHLAVAAN